MSFVFSTWTSAIFVSSVSNLRGIEGNCPRPFFRLLPCWFIALLTATYLTWERVSGTLRCLSRRSCPRQRSLTHRSTQKRAPGRRAPGLGMSRAELHGRSKGTASFHWVPLLSTRSWSAVSKMNAHARLPQSVCQNRFTRYSFLTPETGNTYIDKHKHTNRHIQ